jgi:hypothetical protein
VWYPWLLLIFVMIAVVSILMLAHTSEVIVWSLAYATVAAPVGADLVYFGVFRIRELHDIGPSRLRPGSHLHTRALLHTDMLS